MSINILYNLKGIDEKEIKTQLYNLILILKKLKNEVDIFTTKKTEAKKEEEKKVKEEKEEKKENK